MKINQISYSSAHPKKFLVKEPNIDCGWNLVYWCNKSRGDKKVRNKKLGLPCSFLRHNAEKSWRLFGTLLGRARPKTRQKGEIFLMMHVASHRIWLECIVYPLTYKKNALVSNWPRTRKFNWLLHLQAGKAITFDFSHCHALITLYVQFLCSDWSKFDRWVYAENLCSVWKHAYW